MRAFQTACHPSKILRTVVAVLHLTVFALCLWLFGGWQMIFGLAALAVSTAYAWRKANLQHRFAVHKIVVDQHGKAAVFIGKTHTAFEAEIGSDSLVSPYAVFLQWHTSQGTIWQIVLPDMADPEAFRRLRVWAKWHYTK